LNLVVDIGNTLIKAAIYDYGELKYLKKYTKLKVSDIKLIAKKYPFENTIVSSVRKKHPYFVQHLQDNYHLLILSHKTKVPVRVDYKTPKTLGLDRLAAVVGAVHVYPGKKVLVIDIGTCMTYDYVDDRNVYHGGNISPGIELRLRAMHEFTSSLPLVKRKQHEEMLGKSTVHAMQNGAVLGIKLEIDHFIKSLTKKYGRLIVILTGGDAIYFGDWVESKIFVSPNLVLEGLNHILEYNQIK